MEHQEHTEDLDTSTLQDPTESPKEDDPQSPPQFRTQLTEDLAYDEVKMCYRASAVSKYNSQFHKLFQRVPREEVPIKVYSCALLRDILVQGRLYISRNWLCFYAKLFAKDVKVAIPVVSLRLVKKHRTAGLVPNGLAITTDTGQKYVFVTLLSRDSVYDVLRRICTHLQVGVHSAHVMRTQKYSTSWPYCDDLPPPQCSVPVLKWRRKSSLESMSSSLPDLLGNSTSSLSTVDSSFQRDSPLKEGGLPANKSPVTDPEAQLGHTEFQLLKFFILLAVLLILSSCYLAFRVCTLEEKLSFLRTNLALPLLPPAASPTKVLPQRTQPCVT
ncbi:GRAM domain-containing protein 2A isoform X3 [Arapaima gigas]